MGRHLDGLTAPSACTSPGADAGPFHATPAAGVQTERAVLAISWADLTAGVWTPCYTMRPCADGLLAVGRRWPEWSRGTPPTWAEFVAAREITAADRRWLVARVLLRDRRRLVAWAVDCAESVVCHAGKYETQIRAEVIAPVRAWIAGDDSIDLRAVSDRAWRIRCVATTVV